jgi:hypothetical protein
VVYSILAHAGGLDEMAIILFPVFVGVGVWVLTRGAGPKDKTPRSGPLEPKSKPSRFGPPDPKPKPPRFS